MKQERRFGLSWGYCGIAKSSKPGRKPKQGDGTPKMTFASSQALDYEHTIDPEITAPSRAYPERNLLSAVLTRAIEDLETFKEYTKNGVWSSERFYDAENAYRWLTNERYPQGHEPRFAFATICEILELEPTDIVNKLQKKGLFARLNLPVKTAKAEVINGATR